MRYVCIPVYMTICLSYQVDSSILMLHTANGIDALSKDLTALKRKALVPAVCIIVAGFGVGAAFRDPGSINPDRGSGTTAGRHDSRPGHDPVRCGVVKQAGGMGMVLANTTESGGEIVADSHCSPLLPSAPPAAKLLGGTLSPLTQTTRRWC
jgi:hypothetical protein